MCNDLKLFTGLLAAMIVTLETAEVLTKMTKLVGELCLVLTYNSNEHHTYSTPRCVYEPEISLKILGVPALGAYFENGADIRIPLEDYFNYFCTRVHKLLGDKVHYAFSSDYSIEPKTVAATPSNPHIILFEI